MRISKYTLLGVTLSIIVSLICIAIVGLLAWRVEYLLTNTSPPSIMFLIAPVGLLSTAVILTNICHRVIKDIERMTKRLNGKRY